MNERASGGGQKTFATLNDLRPHLLREGIKARAINGDRLTMAVIELEPHAISPEHKHENEQLGFVIVGSLTMRIGTEKKELRPGDAYVIPSNVPHEAVAGGEGATVTDIFGPIRADWAEMKRGEPSPARWP